MEDRQKVEKFARALSLAIYDKLLEITGNPVYFFYDADVIIKLVLGFENEYVELPAGPRQVAFRAHEPGPRIVRALMSSGYLKEFYLARPHAFELYEEIRQRPQYLTQNARKAFLDRAMHYIDMVGIRDDMDSLLSVIARHENAGDGRAKDFIQLVQEKSARAFAYMEQVNGTWDARLRRYYDSKLLRLDLLGPEMKDLFLDAKSSLDDISDAIEKRRPLMPLNAFQDAAALAILHQFVIAHEKGQAKFLVRFYTETADVRDALEQDFELAKYLTYRKVEAVDSLFTPPASAYHVYRDTSYFMMRALIEELSPLAKIEDPQELQGWMALAMETKDLVADGYPEIEQRLLQGSPKHRLFSDLLNIHENVSVLRPLMERLPVPEILTEVNSLHEWSKIYRFAKENRTKEVLNEEISDIQTEMKSHVAKTSVWAKDFKMIMAAAADHLDNLISLDDPMKDLGLVRWGYRMAPEEQQRLKDTISGLYSSDDSERRRLVGILSTYMGEAREDISLCRTAAAILWALGMFSEVVDLIESCRAANPGVKFPPTLLVIDAAARIRSGNIVTPEGRSAITTEVDELLNQTDPEQRKAMLLGVGYVFYQAWRAETIRFSPSARLPDLQSAAAKHYAQRSFEIAEEASGALDPNTLEWAYAINHCSYVPIITGVSPEKVEEYFPILLGLKHVPALWNARFDDTVGAYYLCRAERIWWSSRNDEKISMDLSDDLANASEYLRAAKRKDPGDIDVQEHLGRLDILSSQIRAFFKYMKEPRK